MSKFRKKSIVIEAVRYLPDGSNSEEIEEFVGSGLVYWKTCNPMIGVLWVGEHEVDLCAGYYVMKVEAGQIEVWDSGSFEAKYEPVE